MPASYATRVLVGARGPDLHIARGEWRGVVHLDAVSLAQNNEWLIERNGVKSYFAELEFVWIHARAHPAFVEVLDPGPKW